MKSGDNSGTVPRVRFREFRTRAGWTVHRTGTIAEVYQGYGFPERFQGSVEGQYPFYKVSDISAAVDKGERVIDTARNYVSDHVIRELRAKPVPAGTTIFAKIGEAIRSDKRAITCRPSLVDNNIAGLKGFPSEVSDLFLFYLWSGVSLADYSGGVVPSVSKSVIESVALACPLLDEQERVADCLASLDDVIAAQARKVEALEAHKRGVMQQLFPREGEAVPRMRFPEFLDAPEWREQPLGTLSTIVRGASPRPIDAFLTDRSDGLNWLKIGDVDRGAKYVTRTADKVRPEALSKTRLIRPGDFILSNSMSFGRPYISTITSCIHDGWIAVTNISTSLSREFLYYSMLADKSQRYFANQAAGSGVKNLNVDIVNALPVLIPDHREQETLARSLAPLDDTIASAKEKLERFVLHKTGLMQQLFASPDTA